MREDYEHQVADLYGQEIKLLELGRMPAMVIVDKPKGDSVRPLWRKKADIPRNEDLLPLLDQLSWEEGER